MSIAIVLRTASSVNSFRDIIVSILGSKDIDEAVLCSGFFQENFKNSPYMASNEMNMANACANSGVHLTTIGVHNSTWKPSYVNFMKNMVARGANIKCLYKPNMRWHAKVFIGSKMNTPIIGIIGSSNITINAFSIGPRFNNECDVFIWDRKSNINRIASSLSDGISENIIIRAPYFSRMNSGETISAMLEKIRTEILSEPLSILS